MFANISTLLYYGTSYQFCSTDPSTVQITVILDAVFGSFGVFDVNSALYSWLSELVLVAAASGHASGPSTPWSARAVQATRAQGLVEYCV